jgi:hypothetical protein
MGLTFVEQTRRYRQKYPERRKAYRKVWKAIKSGRLVRPAKCEHCRRQCRPQAHHEDYSKPLDVQWWCRRCHLKHHGHGWIARRKAA